VTLRDDQDSVEEYEVRYHGENFHEKKGKASNVRDDRDRDTTVESNKDNKQEKKERPYLSAEQVILSTRRSIAITNNNRNHTRNNCSSIV
jgi:predicted metal-dependent peptidase